QGDHSLRWAHAAPDLSLSGEDATRVEIRLGLFRAGRDDQTPGRFSLLGQGRVSVRKGVTTSAPVDRFCFPNLAEGKSKPVEAKPKLFPSANRAFSKGCADPWAILSFSAPLAT